jgi:hypothetical protein
MSGLLDRGFESVTEHRSLFFSVIVEYSTPKERTNARSLSYRETGHAGNSVLYCNTTQRNSKLVYVCE